MITSTPSILVARTDALGARLLTSDVDKYRDQGMTAYVELQEQEFASESRGYTATKHQREVGAGYFDDVTHIITGGTSSITALAGSTEEEQFEDEPVAKQVAY